MSALTQQAQQYFASVRNAYSPKIGAIVEKLKAAGEAFQVLQQELKAEWASYMRSACNAQPGDIIQTSDGTEVLLVALIPEEHPLPGGERLRTFYPLVHARTESGWSAELARYRYTTLPFKVVGHEEIADDGRTLAERMAQAMPDLIETPKPVGLVDDTVEEKPDVAVKPAKKKVPAAPTAAVKKPAKKAAKKAAPKVKPAKAVAKKAPAKKTTAKKSAPKKPATKKAAAKKKTTKKAANVKKVRPTKKSDTSD